MATLNGQLHQASQLTPEKLQSGGQSDATKKWIRQDNFLWPNDENFEKKERPTPYIHPITLEDDPVPLSLPAQGEATYYEPHKKIDLNGIVDIDMDWMISVLKFVQDASVSVLKSTASSVGKFASTEFKAASKNSGVVFDLNALISGKPTESGASQKNTEYPILSTPKQHAEMAMYGEVSSTNQDRLAKLQYGIRTFKMQERQIKDIHEVANGNDRAVQETVSTLSSSQEVQKRVFGLRLIRKDDQKKVGAYMIAKTRQALQDIKKQSEANSAAPVSPRGKERRGLFGGKQSLGVSSTRQEASGDLKTVGSALGQ